MRFMRARVLRAGVKVLDHHPATELLSDGATVTGAAGLVRATGEDWRIEAGATVLATGGCAFFERILGGTGLTGDGLLDGGRGRAPRSRGWSSPASTPSPRTTPRSTRACRSAGRPSTTRTARRSATPAGEPVSNGIGVGREGLGAGADRRAGLCPARPGRAEPLQAWLRQGQPNCFLPYDRLGDRSLPRPLPGHAARRGHGARHRRHPHHQLGMHDRGARALSPPATPRPGRTSRARPRAAARSTRPGRCRAAGGPARAPPATPAAAARRRPSATVSRGARHRRAASRPSVRAPSTRARWWRPSATR